MDNEIKVSVCVVTYNQEKYIAECLQSLVDQETDFKFEIIVSDDCSTDKTREIIEGFQLKHPNLIVPIFHEKNIGALENFKFAHEQGNGEYIAHMDGDDYALPGKLQIQADFLDKNPECNMVFHRMNFIDGEEYVLSAEISNRILAYKFYRSDIIEFVAIGANSSKMYRKELREIKLPDFNLVDYTVNVVQVGSGYAAYCSDKALGVYRRGIGISGSLAVNNAVFNSLNYFIKIYPECKLQINTSAWAWFLSNIKNNKRTKWLFLKIIFQTGVILGLYRYIASRGFRKELSGL